MREFVYGSDKQYELLKKSLEDGRCHVYDCAFPESFSASGGRMGFEKDAVSYILYIDRGLSRRGKSPALFKDWLSGGSLRFLDFSDMKAYLKSLVFLYENSRCDNRGESNA